MVSTLDETIVRTSDETVRSVSDETVGSTSDETLVSTLEIEVLNLKSALKLVEEKNKRLKRHYKNNIKNLSAKLVDFEKLLFKEKEYILMLLKEKDDEINFQNCIIQSLRNEKNVSCCHENVNLQPNHQSCNQNCSPKISLYSFHDNKNIEVKKLNDQRSYSSSFQSSRSISIDIENQRRYSSLIESQKYPPTNIHRNESNLDKFSTEFVSSTLKLANKKILRRSFEKKFQINNYSSNLAHSCIKSGIELLCGQPKEQVYCLGITKDHVGTNKLFNEKIRNENDIIDIKNPKICCLPTTTTSSCLMETLQNHSFETSSNIINYYKEKNSKSVFELENQISCSLIIDQSLMKMQPIKMQPDQNNEIENILELPTKIPHSCELLSETTKSQHSCELLRETTKSQHCCELLSETTRSQHSCELLSETTKSQHSCELLSETTKSQHSCELLSETATSQHSCELLSEITKSQHSCELLKNLDNNGIGNERIAFEHMHEQPDHLSFINHTLNHSNAMTPGQVTNLPKQCELSSEELWKNCISNQADQNSIIENHLNSTNRGSHLQLNNSIISELIKNQVENVLSSQSQSLVGNTKSKDDNVIVGSTKSKDDNAIGMEGQHDQVSEISKLDGQLGEAKVESKDLYKMIIVPDHVYQLDQCSEVVKQFDRYNSLESDVKQCETFFDINCKSIHFNVLQNQPSMDNEILEQTSFITETKNQSDCIVAIPTIDMPNQLEIEIHLEQSCEMLNQYKERKTVDELLSEIIRHICNSLESCEDNLNYCNANEKPSNSNLTNNHEHSFSSVIKDQSVINETQKKLDLSCKSTSQLGNTCNIGNQLESIELQYQINQSSEEILYSHIETKSDVNSKLLQQSCDCLIKGSDFNQQDFDQPDNNQSDHIQTVFDQPDKNQFDHIKIVFSQPDINQSDINRPDINQSDLNQPNINQADNNQPDNNKPNFNQTDINQSGINQPVNNQLNFNQTDLIQSDFNQPIINQADINLPVVNKSDLSQPIISQPYNNPPVINQSGSNQTVKLDFNHPDHNQSDINQPDINQSSLDQQYSNVIICHESSDKSCEYEKSPDCCNENKNDPLLFYNPVNQADEIAEEPPCNELLDATDLLSEILNHFNRINSIDSPITPLSSICETSNQQCNLNTLTIQLEKSIEETNQLGKNIKETNQLEKSIEETNQSEESIKKTSQFEQRLIGDSSDIFSKVNESIEAESLKLDCGARNLQNFISEINNEQSFSNVIMKSQEQTELIYKNQLDCNGVLGNHTNEIQFYDPEITQVDKTSSELNCITDTQRCSCSSNLLNLSKDLFNQSDLNSEMQSQECFVSKINNDSQSCNGIDNRIDSSDGVHQLLVLSSEILPELNLCNSLEFSEVNKQPMDINALNDCSDLVNELNCKILTEQNSEIQSQPDNCNELKNKSFFISDTTHETIECDLLSEILNHLNHANLKEKEN